MKDRDRWEAGPGGGKDFSKGPEAGEAAGVPRGMRRQSSKKAGLVATNRSEVVKGF